MSLRARLALLYTSIVGGILLLFGVAVYLAVSFSLTRQIDNLLRRTVERSWPNLSVDATGALELDQTIGMEMPPGIIFQVWSRKHGLLYSNIPQLLISVDEQGLDAMQPVIRDTRLKASDGSLHLRVISVPLVIGEGDRRIGVLQVATSMAVVGWKPHMEIPKEVTTL